MPNPSADFPAAAHSPTDISVNASQKLGLTNPTHTEVEGKQEEELEALGLKIGSGASTPTNGKVLAGTGVGSSEWVDPEVAGLEGPEGPQGPPGEDGADGADGATGATGPSVKPYLVFTPLSNEAPASAFATYDQRNSHVVLDFDGATDEEAVFSGVLPSNYAGGGLTIETYWAFTSATSGSLRVQTAIERMDVSSLDIDADSFTSFNSAGGSAPGTSGQVIKVTTTHANGSEMDSLAAGEPFRLKIRRDADGTSGTDDITTDAELLKVVIKET